jgi:hypothetical protein
VKQLSDQEISKLNDLTMGMLKNKTKIDSQYFNSLLPELVDIKELQITAKAHIYHFVLIATFCHSSLQNLNLNLCITTQAGKQHVSKALAQLTNLTTLKLWPGILNPITAHTVTTFSKLTQLICLDISKSLFDEQDLNIINALPSSLKSLNLSGNSLCQGVFLKTDIGYEIFTKLINLTHLDISNLQDLSSISPILECIISLRALKVINVSCNKLCDSSLKVIQSYPHIFLELKAVDIRNCEIQSKASMIETIKAFKDHNDSVATRNESLFQGFCAINYTNENPETYLYKDAMSLVIGNRLEYGIDFKSDLLD